jgi:hypothetical protein
MNVQEREQSADTLKSDEKPKSLCSIGSKIALVLAHLSA